MAKNGRFFFNPKSDSKTEAGLAINAAQRDKESGGDGVVDIIGDGGRKLGQVSIHGDRDELAEELDRKRKG